MWHLREHAHVVLTDDGGAILDERTGRWSQLTPTAAAAVMLLLAGSSYDQAAEQYADRYRITPGQARRDIQEVADTLTASGLAHTTRPTAGKRRAWRWWR